MHAETFKIAAGEDGVGLNLSTSVFNRMYRVGKIPTDWLRSTFVTLPKKNKASQCDQYRMISLMSHALKIFLRIIPRCTEYIQDQTAGILKITKTRYSSDQQREHYTSAIYKILGYTRQPAMRPKDRN